MLLTTKLLLGVYMKAPCSMKRTNASVARNGGQYTVAQLTFHIQQRASRHGRDTPFLS